MASSLILHSIRDPYHHDQALHAYTNRERDARASHRYGSLTRFRADDNHIQLPMAIEYYCQRASVPETLITAESSLISPSHGGVPNAPGMWNDEQVEGWKKIVDAVHARGCYIFCQLLAPGRAADATTLQKEAGHGSCRLAMFP